MCSMLYCSATSLLQRQAKECLLDKYCLEYLLMIKTYSKLNWIFIFSHLNI